jgi:two-component system, NarL family, sensor histidine kinase BarA
VISTAVTSVTPQAQKKGVTLEVKMPKALAKRATLDRDRLRQVVVNLLANALKFTPAQGKVTVELSDLGYQPEVSAEGYRISVSDTGVGIPADQFEKIFHSFYQVDNTSTREFGGAGLGLAIVKSFVEAHGGRVLVQSTVGKGSSFNIVLPLTPPAPKTVQIAPPMVPAEPERF